MPFIANTLFLFINMHNKKDIKTFLFIEKTETA